MKNRVSLVFGVLYTLIKTVLVREQKTNIIHKILDRREHMAVGWARDDAVQEQIDATVESAVQLARRRLPQGESLTHCEECEEEIPDARRKAMPGVRCCVKCQSEREKNLKTVEFYNRRGSKDSQLK